MALGTPTVNLRTGGAPSAPFFLDDLTFVGDGAYSAGGTAAFQAFVRTALAKNRNVLGIIQIDPNATYYLAYDKINDKLKVYVRATGVENATADISAQTFRILVISE